MLTHLTQYSDEFARMLCQWATELKHGFYAALLGRFTLWVYIQFGGFHPVGYGARIVLVHA